MGQFWQKEISSEFTVSSDGLVLYYGLFDGTIRALETRYGGATPSPSFLPTMMASSAPTETPTENPTMAPTPTPEQSTPAPVPGGGMPNGSGSPAPTMPSISSAMGKQGYFFVGVCMMAVALIV